MGNIKKDFFYNPAFRVSVYITAWIFIGCFKPLAMLYPKWNKIFSDYEAGQIQAAAIIGFVSGLILEFIFIILTHKDMVWNFRTLGLLLLSYIFLSLAGCISMTKFRDYELEKEGKRL